MSLRCAQILKVGDGGVAQSFGGRKSGGGGGSAEFGGGRRYHDF